MADAQEKVPTEPDAAPSTAAGEAGEEDASPDVNPGEEEDTGAAFTPIVKLEEVTVSSGEEDEDCLFEIKAKLYRYDKEGSQWKERGVGQVKLLQSKQTKKIRLLMRQSRTLKICANHVVIPGTNLLEHAGSDKSWVWHAADFADGELKEEMFAMKFGSIESAQKFKTAFIDAQEKMEKVLEGETDGEEDEGEGEGGDEVDQAAEALGALDVKKGSDEPAAEPVPKPVAAEEKADAEGEGSS